MITPAKSGCNTPKRIRQHALQAIDAEINALRIFQNRRGCSRNIRNLQRHRSPIPRSAQSFLTAVHTAKRLAKQEGLSEVFACK
jgi:hypothetical protein